MTISVVTPVYNGSRTIRATLDSALRQTLAADEILVLDDGSTDDTFGILESYGTRITAFRQENRGVAAARNVLCARATGDLIAFLDSDDLWHREYLVTLRRLFADYPNALAFFTGHVNFEGYGDYQWNINPLEHATEIEAIDSPDFLKRYNESTGYFASSSYLSVPRRVLQGLGKEPFCLDGVEDSYLCTTLPLLQGAVVYAPAPLVAYRITSASLSTTNNAKMLAPWVDVFRFHEERYRNQAAKPLLREFGISFASKRRQYGKQLMAAGRAPEARNQFRQAIGNSSVPLSMAKSLWWLAASYMPARLQPKWPSLRREWKTFVQS